MIATVIRTRWISAGVAKFQNPKWMDGSALAGFWQGAIKNAAAGTWKAGYKPFGLAMGPAASDMVVCGATPEMKSKLDQIKKDILSGKIKVLEG